MSNLRFFLFFSSFFIVFEKNHAQKDSLAGYWEGILTVEREGHITTEYNVAFRFEEKKDSIKGISYVWFEKLGANLAFQAQREDPNTLIIKEISIRQADPLPRGEWCVKEIKLKRSFEGKNTIWQGNWSGKTSFSQCTPGRIIIKRAAERA